MASLLPKLREHFAEFLLEDSLEHLRILTPSTCVRLRYGHPYDSHRGFSRQRTPDKFMVKRPPHRFSELNAVLDLPGTTSYQLGPGQPTPGLP